MNDSIKKSDLLRRKIRPAQMLYVPPAQRHKKKLDKVKEEIILEKPDADVGTNLDANEQKSLKQSLKDINDTNLEASISNTDPVAIDDRLSLELNNCASNLNNCNGTNEEKLVIMLETIKMASDKNVDVEKEEMDRAIVNINRKSRPLIKHINVGNRDVLRIDVDDNELKVDKPRTLVKKIDEVSNWEDLFNEDDEIIEQIVEYIDTKVERYSDDDGDYDDTPKNTEPNDLDHVIELYDFPATFKTQDLVQLYHDVNHDSMYIKWCDETHALLVLSTPAQAKKALQVHHDIIKSRTMLQASLIAAQVATRSDLRPAMKRPETNMQTARRLITRHLGTPSKLSKEEQAKEREQLRKAKELKRVQKQSENDAWDGHPRPSTA